MKYFNKQIEIITAFSVIFQKTYKFLTVFVRLILGKVNIDKFTGSRQKVDFRYQFGFKVNFKGLLCKQRSLQSFFIDFPINK